MSDTRKTTKPNVPNLRFPGFEGEWENKRIGDIGKFFSGGTPSSSRKDFYGGEIPFIRSGEIHSDKTELFLTQEGYKNSSAKMVEVGDILLALYGANSGDISISQMRGAINQAILCIRTNVAPVFFKSVWEKHAQKILNTYLQGGQGNLSADIVKKITISIPSQIEQAKIAALFSHLDERISIQNRLIEKLQSLIGGIAQHCIKEAISGSMCIKLGDICKITTGKLDANAQVDNGLYPFFTCAEQPFKIDNFAFDTEALLISGNGANLGYVNYYNGKFNAYQRTYVLDAFSENIQYIKWALKVLLPKRIAIEKSSSNTPYIVLSTLSDLRLPIPSKGNQCHMAELMQSLERKLSNQIALKSSYNMLKQYLLRQMFI